MVNPQLRIERLAFARPMPNCRMWQTSCFIIKSSKAATLKIGLNPCAVNHTIPSNVRILNVPFVRIKRL